MANSETLIPIPGRLHSVASEGHVAGADEIFDDNKNKLQSAINADVDTAIGTDSTEGTIKGRIKSLETLVGSDSVSTQIDNKINALDASESQTAGADGLALSITETNGKITAISGSIAANTYEPYGTTSTAISGLDATASQTAGTDGLALSITEVDGKITAISGSIAANTYDASGAASAVQTALLGDAATDYNTLGKCEDKIQANASDIDDLEALVPSQATSSNQLADKDFVNSSISTSTATFRGTSATGLTEQQFLTWANGLTKDDNDYVFWNTVDSDGNTQFKRYKYDGTQWVYEYTLNNSSFTSAQWAAIQSGITSNLVDKLSALPTNTDLTTSLGNKADKTATVSSVSYDTTNKKIQKTINGTTTDVVTASTIVTDGGGYKKPSGGIPGSDLATSYIATGGVKTINGTSIEGSGDIKTFIYIPKDTTTASELDKIRTNYSNNNILIFTTYYLNEVNSRVIHVGTDRSGSNYKFIFSSITKAQVVIEITLSFTYSNSAYSNVTWTTKTPFFIATGNTYTVGSNTYTVDQLLQAMASLMESTVVTQG